METQDPGNPGDPRPETLDPGKGVLWRTAVYIPYAYSIMYRVPRALGSIYGAMAISVDLE